MPSSFLVNKTNFHVTEAKDFGIATLDFSSYFTFGLLENHQLLELPTYSGITGPLSVQHLLTLAALHFKH